MSIIESLFAKTPPEILYHYTTHKGFQGIAQSKTLWCTSIVFLNDGKEYLHANDILLERLDHRIYGEDKQKRTQDEIDFLKDLKTGLDRVGMAMFFVGSFSEKGDLLSQWRGYCGADDGISLGFNSARLSDLAKSQGFQLVKCVYRPDEKYAVVDEYIDNYVRDRHTLQNVNDIPFNFAIRFSSIAPILKHESFLEEQEWRLISIQMDARNSNIDLHMGSSILVPHYNLYLTKDGEQLEVDDMIVGPSRIADVAAKAIDIAVVKYKIKWHHRTFSSSPYSGYPY